MRKIGLVLCSGTAALAVLAGCGSPQPAQQAPRPAAKPVGFSTIASLVDTVNSRQNAAKTTRVSVQGTLGQRRFSGNGSVDLSKAGAPSMTMNVNAAGQRTTTVLKDHVSYLRMPFGSDGKPWVRIDSKGADPISQILGKLMSQMSDSANPTRTLEQIKQSGTLTGARTDTVNGAPATHYSVRLDSRKLMILQFESMQQLLGKNPPADMQNQLNTMLSKTPKTLPAEVWVNAQQLPVKYQMTTPVPIQGNAGGAAQQVSMTANYTNWGAPVSITAPAPNQVEDLGTKLKQFGRFGKFGR